MKTVRAVLAFLALGAFLASLALAAESVADTVKSKCASCHNLVRVCAGIGKHDAAAWQKIVQSMVRKGAKLSGEEPAEVSKFLASGAAAGALDCPK